MPGPGRATRTLSESRTAGVASVLRPDHACRPDLVSHVALIAIPRMRFCRACLRPATLQVPCRVGAARRAIPAAPGSRPCCGKRRHPRASVAPKAALNPRPRSVRQLCRRTSRSGRCRGARAARTPRLPRTKTKHANHRLRLCLVQSYMPFPTLPFHTNRASRHPSHAAAAPSTYPSPHPAQNGTKSLMVASRFGHIEVARLLLDQGANVDAAMPVQQPRTHALSTSHGRDPSARKQANRSRPAKASAPLPAPPLAH